MLLSKNTKDFYIGLLTPELSILRAKVCLSQTELANIIGTSRQTYGAIERGTRKMTWETYLTLIMYYDYNKKSRNFFRAMKAYPLALLNTLSLSNDAHNDSDCKMAESFLLSLDEQARSTLKTVLIIEYMRCMNLSFEDAQKIINKNLYQI